MLRSLLAFISSMLLDASLGIYPEFQAGKRSRSADKNSSPEIRTSASDFRIGSLPHFSHTFTHTDDRSKRPALQAADALLSDPTPVASDAILPSQAKRMWGIVKKGTNVSYRNYPGMQEPQLRHIIDTTARMRVSNFMFSGIAISANRPVGYPGRRSKRRQPWR